MLNDIRWRFNHIAGPLFGILLFTYFVYHSIQGQHGILAWRQLDIQITKAEATFASLLAKQAELEQSVIMLRPSTLNLDMVEEQSRRMLNFTHKDDVIVIFSGVK
ncbi:MAG: septum formation initiator [Rhodospirillaceae bacterium]|nr:septum formation initiator [Rhodospirillaceae bacterium]